ncbi:MAG: hypothetical protein N3A66_06675, partial [Planctomycetota bacterium]|nr:hypothetical protein [Planctomycetota bacterium]
LETLCDGGVNDIDRAWATMVTHGQGFSGIAKTVGNWSRAFVSSRGIAETAARWRSRLAMLDYWHKRLSRVQLDNLDALEVVRYWDSPDTVFYLDPPYVADTRVKGNQNIYAHEASNEHHRALVDILLSVKGQAMLSGYAHPIYAPLEQAGWQRVDIRTACSAVNRARGSKLRGDGALLRHVPRTETIWIRRHSLQLKLQL